jgi:hypothetical protein
VVVMVSLRAKTPTAIETTGSIVLKTAASPGPIRETPAKKNPIATTVETIAAAKTASQPVVS